MSEFVPPSAGATVEGPSCAAGRADCGDSPKAADRGLLSGGCCSGPRNQPIGRSPMSRRARRARAVVGAGCLVLAGAMGSRALPGRIALWPAAIVPTWFGISHLVSGATGYQGCPEIGAIPSVMLDRPVTTSCAWWERIDHGSSGWGWTSLHREARPAPGTIG